MKNYKIKYNVTTYNTIDTEHQHVMLEKGTFLIKIGSAQRKFRRETCASTQLYIKKKNRQR